MTGFCGVLIRNPSSARASEIAARWRQYRHTVSRNPSDEHTIIEEGPFHLSSFHHRTWTEGPNCLTTDSEIFVASGNPLLPASDSGAPASIDPYRPLLAALSSGDDRALAESRGSFCAAHYERQTGRLSLCADRLALRPIYVLCNDDLCIFSTTIRLLLHLHPTLPSIDDQGLAEHLYFGQPLGSRTLFSSISVLDPATVRTITATTDTVRTYSDWTNVPVAFLSRDEALAALYESFMSAVAIRGPLAREDAFLSGGMDSRAVVAGLLDLNCTVRSFSYSYPGSTDDVVSRIMAATFGTEHVSAHQDPVDRMAVAHDSFARYAAEHFPRQVSDAARGRRIWSGDGGSVGLGHVYIDARSVDLGARRIGDEHAESLFPQLQKPLSRLMKASLARSLRQSAVDSIMSVWPSFLGVEQKRAIYLYFLLNDQRRHLYAHYEEIDMSGIEFETPFFDGEMIKRILQIPIEWCLYHALYNDWLRMFRAPAAAVPWQTYPGHVPCPMPLPEGIRDQWDTAWFDAARMRKLRNSLGRRALAARDPRLARILDRRRLAAVWALNKVGITRWSYEIDLAARISAAIGPAGATSAADRGH